MRTVPAFCAFVILALGAHASVALAQPSDATVLRDLRAEPGQIGVELHGDGNHPEMTAPGHWEFVRTASIRRHSDDFPGIDVEIVGLAQYQSSNGRSWRYVSFLPSDQHFIGIPDPSQADIDATLRTNPMNFFGGAGSAVLGAPTSGPTIAPDATYTWHTPNSVSFPMVIEFDRVNAERGTLQVVHVRGRYDVRLYRTAVDQPWHNYMSSLVGQLEIVTTRELPGTIRGCVTSWVDVLRGATPVHTLEDCAGEADRAAAALASRAGDPTERASFRVAASPATPVAQTPLVGGVDAVHQALLTMDRAALESFLRARLASRYYAAPGVLNDDGITLVSDALFEVFSAHGSYRTQFCRPLRYDPGHSPPYGMLLVGNIDGVSALIVTPQIGAGLVIDRLQITVRHDDDGVALAAQQHCPS